MLRFIVQTYTHFTHLQHISYTYYQQVINNYKITNFSGFNRIQTCIISSVMIDVIQLHHKAFCLYSLFD
jgi:hypothetical protein